ncbi:DUF6396 domain-containing protein [Pseudomonas sp. KU26590]|uniref:SEL1-like repeat protein n=1 Tax=Pseudomonas sp. KU26590 TaxID=2991051 RepID=UPI00223D62B1|nr:DUF6396 domain-containing protein [Pseudomonas sp. KU26590]UZJ58433.1 DUF6396 domain-containing protein [Pseudomonas sp. KU26590]
MHNLIAYSLPILLYLFVIPEINAMSNKNEQDIIQENLAFECHRQADALPPISQEVDVIYKYGLYLQQKEGPKDFNEAARYYRIAAANGHYKAATNLQALISEGLARSPNAQKETIDLVEQYMALGVPGAYYDMAHYLEAGYGVEQDNEKANAYFRKAADMGSPDAQFYIAKLLGRMTGPKDVMVQMRRCAAYQGHTQAARELAGFLRVRKKYEETVSAYHQGAKSGDATSARRLAEAFKGPSSTDDLYYMKLTADEERTKRYAAINNFLEQNEQLSPKVPDIDSIVPLPPAKLPAWDGTFQWQKERTAKAVPNNPDDALIQRLSKEKNLDPATGLPLPKN